MKLIFAAVFCCIGIVSHATFAQEELTDLEAYYHEIQYSTEGLHTYMKGTFDNIRYLLSDTLYSVNEKSLESALVGIRYVDEIVQIVDAYIAQSTGSQACIDGVTARWTTEKNAVGSRLSQCSQLAEDRIVGLYTPLYNAMEAGQRTSNSVQSLVVRMLGAWNPLSHDYGLDYFTEIELEQLYVQFTTVTVPELQRLLEAIADQDEILPLDVYSCSATAGNEFRGVAEQIQLDVWVC